MAGIRTLSFGEALDEASGRLRSRGLGTGVVGIDGHSAAGKSTFAEALARRAGAALVRGDDFYRVMDAAERAELSPAEGVERYYDWQRLRDQVLTVVRAGATARYRPYDWLTGQLATHFVTVQAAAIVVVEGLFVSRPELGSLVDHAILIDSPAIVRRRRQSERADASNEWLERWDAAERYFFEQIRPPATFDIVVRGVGLEPAQGCGEAGSPGSGGVASRWLIENGG